MEGLCLPDEFVVDLKQGLKLIQSRQGYGLTMDTVLLAHFVSLQPGDRVAELGTGNGAIPLLLTTRVEELTVWGLELQPSLADRAQRSVFLNRLEERIKIQSGDLRQIQEIKAPNTFEVVISNPPYWPVGRGRSNLRCEVAWAKEELGCKLSEVIIAGHWLLRPGGRMALVHLWERRQEVIETLLRHGMKPRVYQEIQFNPKSLPTRILVEAVKSDQPESAEVIPIEVKGKEGDALTAWAQAVMTKIKREPLILYTANREFTPEVKVMYDD
ncbi:MAG: methyltransferase [Syntrophomonadaceae bacterium]|nr:methyltransferase [Syntrophomonadaceae bacterium]